MGIIDLPGLLLEIEQNPFMGLRGIRFSLRNPDVFTVQIRSLLRAGVGYKLKILFPFEI